MKSLFLLILVLSCSETTTTHTPTSVLLPNRVSALVQTLTAIVLKPSVNKAIQQTSKNGFIVGFRLVCINATADTVIDKIFTEGFNKGHSVNEFRKRIAVRMQEEIDAYQEMETIYNSVLFNSSPAIIQSNLNGAK